MATMAKKLRARLLRRWKAFVKFALSKRAIPTLKGVLAYVLIHVLSFLYGYDRLMSKYPMAISAPVIVVVGAQPGKPVGACVQKVAYSLLGVLVGSLNFLILANLGHAPVAQGVLFVVMVYLIALVKAQSMLYIDFSLLSLLMTFNGIYTSLMSGGEFQPQALIAFLEAYAFGAAVVLAVNMLVLPKSSEAQLRQMLVSSLDHVRTFMHLVNKGYLLELSEDEKVVRGQLVQSIRADFGFLNQIIEQTSLEIVWSRWSMADYRQLVLKMRAVQATLIASYSGLLYSEETGSVAVFKERFLPAAPTEFRRIRRDLCLTIGEIMKLLSTEKLELSSPEYGQFKEKEVPVPARRSSGDTTSQRTIWKEKEKDVERQDESRSRFSAEEEEEEEEDHELVLEEVGRRLQKEAADADHGSESSETAVDFDRTSTFATTSELTTRPLPPVTPHGPTLVDRQLFGGKHSAPFNEDSESEDSDDASAKEPHPTNAVKSLRSDFDLFAKKQLDLVAELLCSGGLSEGLDRDTLSVYQPMTSVAQTWGTDMSRGEQEALRREGSAVKVAFGVRPIRTTTGSRTPRKRYPASPKSRNSATEFEDEEEDPNALVTGKALVRVYSMLFSMNRLVNELQSLHAHVTTTPGGAKRHYHLHIHFWENLRRPHPKKPKNAEMVEDMCLKDALSQLEQTAFVRKKVSIMQRLLALEQWSRTPNSIYAFKMVLALCVFAVLDWAPNVRGWFISYALATSVPTIVIALTPTLGQSFFQFTFQILGTGIGTVVGMILLLIFRNVGGYFYNPYGLACSVAIYGIPFSYIIHEKPQLFIFALLSMNSTGVLIITEYVQTVSMGNVTFDSAPLRAGKTLAGLAVAIGLVLCFQLLILRNPARRTLRKAVARLLEEHLAYLTMLQAYCRALGPIDPTDRPPKKVVLKVERELKRREAKLQAHIISMNPLIAFAAAEPQWESPFQSEAFTRILRANQILLDRWSEARSAIGTEPFPAFISREFISVLSPYRRAANVHTKVSLYLSAASMASKVPLPLEVPKPGKLESDVVHDALLLSARFAKTEEGQEAVRSGEFARYWFFLLVMTSACRHVESIEEGCRMSYGSFEDKML